MTARMHFELVSPEKLLLSEEVEMVVVPGAEGDFGAMAGHAPVISTLRPGVLYVFNGGALTERLFVEGGFAEVTPKGCTVLAEKAQPVGDIDRARAEEILRDAREDAEDAKDPAQQSEAAVAVAIAEARLKALDSLGYAR